MARVAHHIEVHAVKNDSGWECTVSVEGGGKSRTTHIVSLSDEYFSCLTGSTEPPTPELVANLVRRSFEFLLRREPKESILRRFDLPVIARYFPEYEREIGQQPS